MIKQRTGILSVVGLLAIVTPVWAGDTLESVEKTVAQQWAKHTSVVATLTMNAESDQNGKPRVMEGTGQFELLKADGAEKVRMQVKSRISMGTGDELRRVHSESLTIDDGKFVYSYLQRFGRREAYKHLRSEGDAFGGQRIFDELRAKGYELKLLPDETVGERKVFVVEANPSAAETATPLGKATLYLDQETGLLLKKVALDPAKTAKETVELTDVTYDAELDATRFVFEAPEGVMLRDQTAAG